MSRLGINGFGRIGRLVFRAAFERDDIEIVGVNDPFMDTQYMAYLLKYDSIHGPFPYSISTEGKKDDKQYLIINGKRVQVFKEFESYDVRWDLLQSDVVLECTGSFTTTKRAEVHLEAGAKKVIISAPSDDAPTYIVGVNEHEYNNKHKIISNASCTANSIAPLVKILDEVYGIEHGFATSIHAITAKQSSVDGPSSKRHDWRAGRCASNNIIPTSTGAARTLERAMPTLKGKITGAAFRVPVTDVSAVDFTVRFKSKTSLDEIYKLIENASNGALKGILDCTDEDVVSSDFVHHSASCIFDKSASLDLNGHFFKLVCWYDNEWGYSNRLLDMVKIIDQKV